MSEIPEADIIEDIRKVAERLVSDRISRSTYIQHGRFSTYQIYDGGRTWESLCAAAGLKTLRVEPVPDEIYFQRLKIALNSLGRLPKVSERKRFGLNFSKRRYPTLKAFIDHAVKLGIISLPQTVTSEYENAAVESLEPPVETTAAQEYHPSHETRRPVPPIPQKTKRTKWERTGIDGFPYAPQDELGVVALFSILCAKGQLGWQILELRGGKGIDATCFDHVMGREIRVELKHTLSRTSWNHKLEDIDYVVCWENRWPDFQKPVIALRDIIGGIDDLR